MNELRKLDAVDSYKRYSYLSSIESDKYATWNSACKTNRNFYVGNQWTTDEITANTDRGQYTLSMNKVRKAVKGMVGMVASALPQYILQPIGTSDNAVVDCGNKLLTWVWNNSRGIYTYRDSVKMALIDNIAYINVIYESGLVKYKLLTFDDVVISPSSKEKMFDDAPLIAIRRYIPVEAAKQLYGISDLTFSQPPEWTSMSMNDSEATFLGTLYDVNREFVKVYETYRKVFYRDNNGDLSNRIVKETLIGYYDVYVEELPDVITEFPIIPIYVEHLGNPYTYGEVQFIKDIQKFINKAYGITILNAQLNSNPKIFVRETDIPSMDMAKFEDNYANPGSVNVLSGNAEAPTVIRGDQLNTAWFQLFMSAEKALEDATLPRDIMGYTDKNTGRVSSYMLDLKESVLDSLKDFTGNLELAMVTLAKVTFQYISGYMSKDKINRILEGDVALNKLNNYKATGLDITNNALVEDYRRKAIAQGMDEADVEDIIEDALASYELVNNIGMLFSNSDSLKFDIAVIPNSFAPTFQMAMLRLMIELYNLGVIDSKPVLENSPVPDKEDMIKRYDKLRSLEAKISELMEENAQIKGLLDNSQQSLLKERMDTMISREKVKLEKFQNQEKLKGMVHKGRQMLNDKARDLKTKEALLELKELVKENPEALREILLGIE